MGHWDGNAPVSKAFKAQDGDRQKKLFQFLNEIGARALRIQLGRVLEMAESSNDRYAYANKIAARFGGQQELELVVPTPPLTPTVRQVTADELPLFAQLGAPGNEAAN